VVEVRGIPGPQMRGTGGTQPYQGGWIPVSSLRETAAAVDDSQERIAARPGLVCGYGGGLRANILLSGSPLEPRRLK